MRRFVLISYMRFGASRLVRALRARPEVLLHGALFQTPEEEALDGAAQLRDHIYVDDGKHSAVGFRLNYAAARSGPSSSAWSWLEEQDDLIVLHATRDDLVASYVEKQIAYTSQSWKFPVEGDAIAPSVSPFRIDPSRLTAYFADIERYGEEVRRRFARHPMLELEYVRNTATNLQSTCDAVARRLGLPPLKVTDELKRRSSLAIEPFVSNWDELQLVFENTPYSSQVQRS